MTGPDFVGPPESIEQLKTTIDVMGRRMTAFADGEFALFQLLGNIRKAAGDPEGKLMQDELIAHIAGLKRRLDAAMAFPEMLRDQVKRVYGCGPWGQPVLIVADELQQALAGENTKEPGA